MAGSRENPDLGLFGPQGVGSLGRLKSRVARGMSEAIRKSGMEREKIAAGMSAFLGEKVPKTMLDAYSSESRDGQNVPLYRFIAFVFVTGAWSLFDSLASEIGAGVAAPDEVQLLEIARMEKRRAALDSEIAAAKAKLNGGAR